MQKRTIAAAAAIGISAVAGSVVAAGGRPLSTDMSGAEEAPGPGDADATGTADFTLNQGQREICFDLDWAGIDGTVTAAHIHRAPLGAPGPVVVPLFVGESLAGTDAASGCATAERALVKEIRMNPTAFYVNVHSTVFGPGAIRGQLGD